MKIIGHRGAKGDAPENTIAGFQYAKNLGLGAIELDVLLTKDNQLAVIHDCTVDRTTNATGNVADFTSQQLARLDARSGFEEYSLPCGVPTLDSVLNILQDIAFVQIEIKRDDPSRLERTVPALLEAIYKRQLEDKIIITSFSFTALEILQGEAPGYPIWSLLGTFDTLDWLVSAEKLGCKQVNVSTKKASADIVDIARKKRFRVGGYGCHTKEDLSRALELNLESVTTDYPTILRTVLTNQHKENQVGCAMHTNNTCRAHEEKR